MFEGNYPELYMHQVENMFIFVLQQLIFENAKDRRKHQKTKLEDTNFIFKKFKLL